LSLWTDDRLDDRFKGLDAALASVQSDVRIVLPVVKDVGGAVASAEAAERTIIDVRGELRELRKEVREDRAKNRSEMVTFVLTLLGFFSGVSLLAVGAVLTGLVG
jgi:hypothetical protein